MHAHVPMRMRCECTTHVSVSGAMKKRKRVEEGEGEEVGEVGEVGEETRGDRKKVRIEEDPLRKFLDLVEADDTAAGLTYFLTTTRREDGATLIGAYLQQCPSCEHLLVPLQWARDMQTHDMMLLCFECLESVLLHTASATQSETGSGMGRSPGHMLAGVVLRNHMRPLYSALMTSSPMKLVAACLRVLTAMVMQGHTAARDVLQHFNFAYKSLIVLPNRTNRVKGSSDSVRTYFIKFALSFLIAGDNDVVRNVLSLKKFLSSVFKLLPEDPVEIVHLFLSTLREKVLRNSGVSKRAKSALFNHYALKQLSALLCLAPPMGGVSERRGRRKGEEFQVVSRDGGEVVCVTLHDYVLEVLTELCTSFQSGVCYRTKTESLLTERTNNSAILQLLLSLTGSLSVSGVQSLVTRSIATCPDLLTPYLHSANLSLEPRPHSKWIDNIEFLTSLLSGLPPVPEILRLSGVCLDEALVPAAASLTVPRATPRAMFNQGVQNPTPLVRLKTLHLIEVVLQRASETAATLRTHQTPSSSSSPPPLSLTATSYTDSVLKVLPELKTLVNLWQGLQRRSGAGSREYLEQARSSGDTLSLEHRLANTTLLEDSTDLLTRCLEVMRGYQLLSPSLFPLADFNPAKLLPSSLTGLTAVPHSVLVATLGLLGETPVHYFKWQDKKCGVLPSLLWLVVHCDGDTYHRALTLTLKLLLSVDSLSRWEVEVGVVLTAARRFSSSLCLPPEEREGDSRGEREEERNFVEMLADLFFSFIQDPQKFTKLYLALQETCAATTDSSVATILAGELEVPTAAEVVAAISGDTEEPLVAHSCPLLLCVVLTVDREKYFPFVCDVVVKLLLGQSDPQTTSNTASLLLSLLDQWRSSEWCGLSQSLTSLLRYCAGSTNTSDMEVDAEEASQLSSRKCVKKLMKMTTSESVKLLTSVSRDVLLDCVVATATRPHLHRALLYSCALRPLQLVLYHDNPAVQDLLPSLPLPSLLLQCVLLEPTTTSPYLSLSLPSPQQWQDSLRTSREEEEDTFGVLCSVRMLLSVLHTLCSTENLEGAIAVADVCFHVLELVLKSTETEDRTSETCVSTENSEPSSFSTLLTNSVFTSPLVLSLLYRQPGGGGGGGGGGGEGEGLRVECVRGVGGLLATALRVNEGLKMSVWFRRLFEGLLERIIVVGDEEEEGIDKALFGVLEITRPHLIPSLLNHGIDCLLHTLTLSPHPSPHLSQALFTLLTPSQSKPENIITHNDSHTTQPSTNFARHTVRDQSSRGEDRIRCPTNEPPGCTVSGSTVGQLLEVSLRPDCAVLCQPALALVSRRLGCTYSLTLASWASLELERGVGQGWCESGGSRGGCDSGAGGGAGGEGGCENGARGDEFVKAVQVVASKASLKGLCPPFLKSPNTSSRSKKSCVSWLPQDLLHRLLDSSVSDGASVALCSLAGCLLLHMSDHNTLDYFSSSCVTRLCSSIESSAAELGRGGGGSALERDLFLLSVYLAALLKHRDTSRGGDGGSLKEIVKMVCKSVWKKCAAQVPTDTHSLHSPAVQGLSVRVLCTLCQLSSKVLKKMKKLAQSWDVSYPTWTRHQVGVVGGCGCIGEGDREMCVMAVKRLLCDPTLSLSTTGQEWSSLSTTGKQWRQYSTELLHRLWVVLHPLGFGGDCFPSEEWHIYFQKSTSGGVRLSSVVACLCAGVKVLYAANEGEGGGEGEGEGEGRSNDRGLMTLEDIHSTLWDHSEFSDILFSTSETHQNLASKEKVVELLVFVSERCPAVCATSRVASLLGAYSASCSKTDRGLLFLLLLYELNGANLGKSRPYLWGEAGRELERERQRVGWLQWERPGTRQVLESLDQHRMTLSLHHFPQLAPLEPTNPFTMSGGCVSTKEEESVYDPAFLLPLISHLLDPDGLVECREMVRSGVLSYLLVSLSSHMADTRKAATHCLSRFYAHLRSSTCREKPQLSLLLGVVRNTMEEEPQRLPSLHTVFCARVAHTFLKPELQLYLLAGHYLVHKPSLELRDIPLFNTLFLHTSSTTVGGSECEWLLEVLAGGLRCVEDYRLYQRKRIFPHLLTLSTGPSLNCKARTLVLELILRACPFPVAVSDLVWNHGLLPWLSQISSPSNESVCRRILTKVCGLVEREGSESEGAWKPPPLLEEELSLTLSRHL